MELSTWSNSEQASGRKSSKRLTDGFFGFLCFALPLLSVLTSIVSQTVFYMISILFAALMAFVLMVSGSLRLGIIRTGLPLFAMFGAAVFSTVFSMDRGHTLVSALLLMPYLMVFFGLIYLTQQDLWRWLDRVLLALPIAVLAVSLFSIVVYGSVRTVSAEMREEVGTYSNFAAATVLPCLPFLLARARNSLRAGDRGFLLVLIAIAASFIVVIIAESRAGLLLLAVLLVLCVAWMVHGSAQRIRMLALGGGALAFLAIGSALALGAHQSAGRALARMSDPAAMVQEFGNQPIKGQQDFARLLMYFEGMDAIRSNPIKGIGYHTLEKRMEARYGVSSISHNILITAWGEAGLLGLFAMLWLLFASLRRTHRARLAAIKQQNLIAADFLAAAEISVLLVWAHALVRPQLTNVMFYVVMGVALMAPSILKSTQFQMKSR